jgi:hypothetical protein
MLLSLVLGDNPAEVRLISHYYYQFRQTPAPGGSVRQPNHALSHSVPGSLRASYQSLIAGP